jgi:ribosome-associated protein
MEFKITTEFIELIKLLKVLGIAENGGHAKAIVDDGEVKYNGVIDFRKRLKVRPGDVIEIGDETIKVI